MRDILTGPCPFYSGVCVLCGMETGWCAEPRESSHHHTHAMLCSSCTYGEDASGKVAAVSVLIFLDGVDTASGG